MPFSIVGNAVRLIVELPNAFHLIELPISLVKTTILIVKLSESVLLPIQLITLVPTALPVLLRYVLTGIADPIRRSVQLACLGRCLEGLERRGFVAWDIHTVACGRALMRI
jgi:hypothetical protein